MSALLGLGATVRAQNVNVAIVHPYSVFSTEIHGISASGQQVGSVKEFASMDFDGEWFIDAAVWTGTAASFVNLHRALGGGTDVPATSSVNFISGGIKGGQRADASTANRPHAVLWTGTTMTDLHPTSLPFFGFSSLNCGTATQQGGYAREAGGNAFFHAAIWAGTAASMVDLTPPSVVYNNQYSEVLCTDGVKQGGYVNGHAALWSGTAASYVDLNPVGAFSSQVNGIGGSKQFGWVKWTNTSSPRAAMWTGKASTFVDLTPAGSSTATITAADGNYQCGLVTNQATGKTVAGIWSGSAVSFVDLSKYLPPRYLRANPTCIVDTGTTILVGGSASFDNSGRKEAIIWTVLSTAASAHYHPADSNRDFNITPAEFLAYKNAYVSGSTAPAGVVPVPIDYVTRADYISRTGQSYTEDTSQAAPLKWVPDSF